MDHVHPETLEHLDKMIDIVLDTGLMSLVHCKCSIVTIALADNMGKIWVRYPRDPIDCHQLMFLAKVKIQL